MKRLTIKFEAPVTVSVFGTGDATEYKAGDVATSRNAQETVVFQGLIDSGQAVESKGQATPAATKVTKPKATK